MSVTDIQINHTTITTLLQRKIFLPLDIASLVSIVVFLSGILCNAFLGLYVGEKLDKPCGVRTLMCNQVFANLVALFSYTIVPLHVLDKEPAWNHEGLCKVIPSAGFLGVSVSLTNVAAICVSYYCGKKNGKFAVCSPGTSFLVVVGSWLLAIALTIPMITSLKTLEVKVNHTKAIMCGAVWPDENERDIYMNWVIIFKYAVPLIIIFSVCLKTELLYWKSKKFQQCREISSFLINVVAAASLIFLTCFFPLSSMGAARFTSRSPGVVHAIDIIQVLEFVALANCAMVPMLLTVFFDEYIHAQVACDYQRITKPTPDLFVAEDDKESALEFPSNTSSITYDVLTADIPEKWRPNPSGVLIV